MSQKQCCAVLVVFYQVAHDFDIPLWIFILITWLRWCLSGMFIPFPLHLFFYLYTCLLIYIGTNSWSPVTIKWVKNLLLLLPVLMLKLSPICPTETSLHWYPLDLSLFHTQQCLSLFCNISIPALESAISARTTGHFNWKIKIGDEVCSLLLGCHSSQAFLLD